LETNALLVDFETRRRLIESGLRSTLGRITAGTPPTLAEAMGYSLLAPGKRLRPLLVVLACEAADGGSETAIPAACAVEMVHAYSLIHDDLPAMDDDDLRRGLPTCHKKFGEALAILAGDALMTGAFQVLAEGYPPRTAAVSCAELARGAGATGMVAGQVLDLCADGKIAAEKAPRTANDLEEIHARKTGALFQSALRLGLFAAQGERADGPDPATRDALDRFGGAFGLAFQIADDVLDVQGSTDRTGKRVGKDATRGKLTFPGLWGVEESRRRARELYAEAAAALACLGSAALPLAELAQTIAERDR
jgi:geranylgeranyl diphosphate synthase, type II